MPSRREQIEESISRIKSFPPGYPRLIVTGNEKADAFFAWEFSLAKKRAEQLEELAVYNSQNGQIDML